MMEEVGGLPRGSCVIDHKDFMHGAALVAIADCDQFMALNKASVRYGQYVVNNNRQVLIKYRDGDGPGDYLFTFQPDEKQRYRDTQNQGKVFIVLVCGNEAITGLSLDELAALIGVNARRAEGVKVVAEPNRGLRLSGPHGSLKGPIARNAFPQRILS
jgi:hypothetical protein